MKFKINHLFVALLVLFFLGCGSDSSSRNQNIGGGVSGDSFDENEKSYLYNLFLTEYYWNDWVPLPFDDSVYTEPQQMIDALRYTAIDRWSFSLTQQEYDALSAQSASGFGFGYMADFTVYLVRIDSPAQDARLMRGDKIISVDGQPVSEMLISQASNNLNQTTNFGIERSGAPMNISIMAQNYSFKVASSTVLQTQEGKRVGYLRFDAFTESAIDELEGAFTYFKGQAIDKLVIDLRYNGGGSINTASILLDKIGSSFDGKLQFTLEWNDQNINHNESLYFDSQDPNSLSLSKLVFLTTSQSASASELVINAMEPYMQCDVAIIGTQTHGKPVGMSGRTNGSYIYFLVNFVVANSVGFFDYFSGLPADCQVEDKDFVHQLGDPNEALLNKALYFIDNNHC